MHIRASFVSDRSAAVHSGCMKEGLQGLQSTIYLCDLERIMRGAWSLAPPAAFAKNIVMSRRSRDACAVIAYGQLALSREHPAG